MTNSGKEAVGVVGVIAAKTVGFAFVAAGVADDVAIFLSALPATEAYTGVSSEEAVVILVLTSVSAKPEAASEGDSTREFGMLWALEEVEVEGEDISIRFLGAGEEIEVN